MVAKRLKLLQSRADWLVILLAGLALLKLAIVWDQAVTVVNGPHDDSLYVYRAVHLLSGDSFGPYTSTTLVKYPGLSLWLAAGAALGLPYLLALNVLYVGAGLYLCAALRANGVPRVPIALGAILYLFHPFTFSFGWTRILREPLATVLLVAISASLLFVLKRLARGQIAVVHVAIFAVALTIATLTREEDILLYVIPVVAAIAVLFSAYRGRLLGRKVVALTVVALGFPVCFSLMGNAATRVYVAHVYGLPILHDFGEGEFPKMIAALRSIHAKKDNRYVMVPQEALASLSREVPRLEPVIRRLAAPGRETVSCQWLGVCTEWAAGWFLYWIKDAAYDAGLTRDLRSGQAYFRAVREDIEAACSAGRLQCSPKGRGLMPPFELRWTRALVKEAADLSAMLVRPDAVERQMPTSSHDVKLDNAFARVTHSKIERAPESLSAAQALELSQRSTLDSLHGLISMVVIVAAVLLACFALVEGKSVESVLTIFLIALTSYVVIRLAALSYLALYMGRYDPRMVISTHMLLVLCAPCIIASVATSIQGAKIRGAGYIGPIARDQKCE